VTSGQALTFFCAGMWSEKRPGEIRGRRAEEFTRFHPEGREYVNGGRDGGSQRISQRRRAASTWLATTRAAGSSVFLKAQTRVNGPEARTLWPARHQSKKTHIIQIGRWKGRAPLHLLRSLWSST